MKILMIHPHDIYSCDEPWTIRIVSLAEELLNFGHQVKLAHCPLRIDRGRRNSDIGGIEIITLSRKAGLTTIFANLKKIRRAAEWADIIHFQKCFHYIALPAILSAWLLDKPIHYDWDDWEEKIWYHSNKMSVHTLLFGNFINFLERSIPKLADTVSVSSRKLWGLCHRLGVEEGSIFKVPVGADIEKFNPHISGERIRQKYGLNEKRVVLYLGQLHGGQYVRMFIEAAQAALSEYPDSVFMVIGQGFMLGDLRRFTMQLGIDGKVIFTGYVPHGLMPEYIAASDICVASFDKNEVTECKSPLKVAEYLASGKPIVASLVGEIRDMVGGVGLLVEPGSHQALAEAILCLLRNPELRQDAASRARRRAEESFTWRHSASSLISAYETALTRKNRDIEREYACAK